jgi:hypothetical protein
MVMTMMIREPPSAEPSQPGKDLSTMLSDAIPDDRIEQRDERLLPDVLDMRVSVAKIGSDQMQAPKKLRSVLIDRNRKATGWIAGYQLENPLIVHKVPRSVDFPATRGRPTKATTLG